jgi:hypothetical protein
MRSPLEARTALDPLLERGNHIEYAREVVESTSRCGLRRRTNRDPRQGSVRAAGTLGAMHVLVDPVDRG